MPCTANPNAGVVVFEEVSLESVVAREQWSSVHTRAHSIQCVSCMSSCCLHQLVVQIISQCLYVCHVW